MSHGTYGTHGTYVSHKSHGSHKSHEAHYPPRGLPMSDIYHGETDHPPLHGYRGEAPAAVDRWPCGLTIAISREAGARGGSIAQRIGRKLGWQVVDQDQLEYLAQDDHVLDELPDAARAWAELRLDELLRARTLST